MQLTRLGCHFGPSGMWRRKKLEQSRKRVSQISCRSGTEQRHALGLVLLRRLERPTY